VFLKDQSPKVTLVFIWKKKIPHKYIPKSSWKSPSLLSLSNSPFSSSLSQYFEEGDPNMLLSQRSKFYPQGKPSKISLMTKWEELRIKTWKKRYQMKFTQEPQIHKQKSIYYDWRLEVAKRNLRKFSKVFSSPTSSLIG